MEEPLASKIEKPVSSLLALVAIFFALTLIAVTTFIGHRAWNNQTLLTQAFESCMQEAPFKNSTNSGSPEGNLNPENLQKHFDEFNEIFDRTGLPPIWNGTRLVPWREYHKESIQVAQQCHQQIGITQPQLQLRGTYAKPVWDPESEIWQSEPPTT